ncbi:zinc finger protein JAGGED-like [Helianthus annuus]|uniref:zinc finger protein JAGGED-like n=1 Tax=Helianthus annuus TaxID=4232 RepID=UPI000B9013D5|nr:zinc finger protein JAGGED-like [Helianthus annuus]
MYQLLFCGTNNMRNPLDLNNLPDDKFIRDHSKQPLNDSSSAASGIYRSDMKNSSKDHERGKVYECRFCSLKFRKSQALGGHMNRHRQEREAESLNQARQLVFGTDNMLTPPPHQLCGQPVMHGGYNYAATGFNMGGTVYPTRFFSGSSTTILPPPMPPTLPPPPPPHQHMHTSLASHLGNAELPRYSNSQLINDYFVDRYVSSNPQVSFHSSRI